MTSKRSIRKPAVLTVSVLVIAVTVGVGATGNAFAAGRQCSDVHFVGARGSGESEGLGHTVGTVYRAMDRDSRVAMSYAALDYPAAPVPLSKGSLGFAAFSRSMDTGAGELSAYLQRRSAQCPNQRFVLAGYSQGAAVVGDALPMLSSRVASRVEGVVLIGDPRFDPAFPNSFGTFDHSLEGSMAVVDFDEYVPRDFVPKTAAFCLAGDAVCNVSFSNVWACTMAASGCGHGSYFGSGLLDRAAHFLIDSLGSSEPAPERQRQTIFPGLKL